MKNYQIYEMTDTTCSDKYTCLLGKHIYVNEHGQKVYDCVTFNEIPYSPNMGIWQHGECIKGKFLGKRIKLEQLPDDAKKRLTNELKEIGLL